MGYLQRDRQTGRADRLEGLVREDEFLVPEGLGLGLLTARHRQDKIENLAAHLVERCASLEDRAGVHVHVLLHPAVRLGVGADLDDRGDGRPDHGPAPVVARQYRGGGRADGRPVLDDLLSRRDGPPGDLVAQIYGLAQGNRDGIHEEQRARRKVHAGSADVVFGGQDQNAPIGAVVARLMSVHTLRTFHTGDTLAVNPLSAGSPSP